MIYDFFECEDCDDWTIHYGLKMPARCIRHQPAPHKRNGMINIEQLKLEGAL